MLSLSQGWRRHPHAPWIFAPVDLWLFEMQKTGQGEKKPRATRAPLLPTSGLKHGECRTAAEAMKGPPR